MKRFRSANSGSCPSHFITWGCPFAIGWLVGTRSQAGSLMLGSICPLLFWHVCVGKGMLAPFEQKPRKQVGPPWPWLSVQVMPGSTSAILRSKPGPRLKKRGLTRAPSPAPEWTSRSYACKAYRTLLRGGLSATATARVDLGRTGQPGPVSVERAGGHQGPTTAWRMPPFLLPFPLYFL
jgi:hypothetical protein